MNSIITQLDLYFGKKAPQLPKSVKNFLVKAVPYLTIIGILIMIPALLVMFGFSAMFGAMPYAAGASGFGIWTIFSIVILILYIIALPGLFKPSAKGWNFLFYACLVSALQSLLMLNIVSLIIGLIISFYILFQLRPYYFGGATVSDSPVTPAQ